MLNYSISKSAIQNIRYCRNFVKARLKLSQYMVASQESINSRFCSMVEIKLSFFLKGGHLPRSGSKLRWILFTFCNNGLFTSAPGRLHVMCGTKHTTPSKRVARQTTVATLHWNYVYSKTTSSHLCSKCIKSPTEH